MKKVLVIGFVLSLASAGPAAADGIELTEEESARVDAILADWGCEGGTREAESTGVFEIDDAICAEGEYDFYIDQNFSTFAIVKH